MFILEQRHGNDGYAFWFKLLELLGVSEGHYLDLNEVAAFEFLASKTLVSTDICTEILDLLAKLHAIDPEMWKSKIIWSDNFVDGITDAYRNRVLDIPKKPDILRKKPPETPQSDVENPQTKLDEIKTNEKKENNPPTPPGGKRPPKKFKTPLPPDFGISAEVRKWATIKGFDRLDEHLEAFVDKSIQKGYTNVDWDRAFKSAIREDWGKVRENGKDIPVSPSPKKRHNPSCPRCQGSGTYLSGKTPDSSPIYSLCNCDEVVHGKNSTAN